MSNLRSAMKLYQENGDPISSLREYQKVWNQSAAVAASSSSSATSQNTNEEDNSSSIHPSVSRQHNETILQNLAAQRQRSRRVRRRPSSFDDNSSADHNNSNNNIDSATVNDSSNAATSVVDGDGKRGEGQSNVTTTAVATNTVPNETGGDLITVLNNILTSLSVHPKHQRVDSPPPPPNNTNNSNSNRQLDNTEQIQELITAYNLSLAHYAQGEYTTALHELGGVLSRWMEMVTIVNRKSGGTTKEKNGGKQPTIIAATTASTNSKEMIMMMDGDETMVVLQLQYDTSVLHLPLYSNYVTSIMSILTRVTFLYLDCTLNIHVGNGVRGLGTTSNDDDDTIDMGEELRSVQDVLKWVETVILGYAKQRVIKQQHGGEYDGSGGGGSTANDDDEVLMAEEVKFKLHLYKSRVLLQGGTQRGTRSGKQQQQQQTMDGETRARLARKELKNAMDIYQNKLCVVVEDGGGSEGRGIHGEKEKNKGGGGGGGGGGGSGDKHRGGKGNNHHHHQDTSETTSISGSLVTSASDALWNEGKGGVVARATFEGMPNNKQQQQQQQQQPATVASSPTTTAANKVKVKKDNPGLHVRHESALYMKANLEYMRGNTTKSLKLCAEARTSGKKSRVKPNGGVGQSEENGFVHTDDAVAVTNGIKSDATTTTEEDFETQMANDYDEAIYYNNLAMVHQSAGKIHVALHYYSYAISYMENVQLPNDNYFWSDGVPRPNITADILSNASLCAFQAHDYKRAYECMVHCVTLSPSIFGKRARCWLHMAQSLIGTFVFCILIVLFVCLETMCSSFSFVL